jgi:hypothetical protein
VSEGGRRPGAPPGEPGLKLQAAVGMALIACGWLGVALSGLCSASFLSLGGEFHWRNLFSLEGFFGIILFVLIFGCVPLAGSIVMFVFTRRFLRWRKRGGR